MSEPYSFPEMDIKCPYCGAPDDGQVEDLGDHPNYLSGTCGECERDYSVDTAQEIYYDEQGNVIKTKEA